MSQYDDYDLDADDQHDDGPKGLRAALKKAQDELKKAAKERDDYAKQVNDLSAKFKAQSLTSILRDKGVNPKLARWIEKDGIDADEDAVQAWLDDNKELFNITTNSAPARVEDEQGQESSSDDGDPFAGVPEALRPMLAAMQRQQAVESNGFAGDSDGGDREALIGQIGDNAKSEADIRSALQALGAPIV